MNNFSYVKISDIGTVTTGRTPKTSNPNNYGNDYMFIGPTDLHKHFLITESERMVTQQGFDSIKSSTLNGVSVLVGCIGWDMGNIGIVEGACVTNQQINSITNIRDRYNPFYIYYWLKTKKIFFFHRLP
ncbi:restriction endonuclease subunit S [Psychrobacter sp. WY6]|uniref:restriction endonuclease subunit S n=1 Tax=Psychrobacter sp. WY6 TaxID=2708350 RepID=UPI002022FC9A|nr:restriction endonuclease subunit S [Psychrobacter sp. WY6]